MIDAQDAWAVGAGGMAMHWDGSAWTTISSGTSVQLNHISLIAPKKQPNAVWEQIFR